VAKSTEWSRLNREYATAVEWLVEASLQACTLSRYPCDDKRLKRSQDEVAAALAACNRTRRAIQNCAIRPNLRQKSAAHG
jgi:hypothetical protein